MTNLEIRRNIIAKTTKLLYVSRELLMQSGLACFILGITLLLGGLLGLASAQNQNTYRFGFEGNQPQYVGDTTNSSQNYRSDAPRSYSEAAFDDTLIRNSVGNLYRLLEGAFGALLMVVAGLAAIIAAAMGNYKSAISMLVVAVGAFILRALVSLFFGENYFDYQKN